VCARPRLSSARPHLRRTCRRCHDALCAHAHMQADGRHSPSVRRRRWRRRVRVRAGVCVCAHVVCVCALPAPTRPARCACVPPRVTPPLRACVCPHPPPPAARAAPHKLMYVRAPTPRPFPNCRWLWRRARLKVAAAELVAAGGWWWWQLVAAELVAAAAKGRLPRGLARRVVAL
jgi:hypothetical protein